MVEFWDSFAARRLNPATAQRLGGSEAFIHVVLRERISSFIVSLALPHVMLFACSQPATSTGAAPQAAALQDKAASADSSG